MSYPATTSRSSKSTRQRPYKARRKRHEASRGKQSEASDHRFLWRVGSLIVLLLVAALAFALKGMTDQGNTPAEPTEVLR